MEWKLPSPIEDYLAQLAGFEGLVVPDDMYDSLTGIFSSQEAMVTQLQQELADARAEIIAVKAHNYELMTNGGVESNEPDTDDADEPDDADDAPKDTVDSLFTDSEDEE